MGPQSGKCENCGAAGSRLFNWNNRRVCIQCRADLESTARQHPKQDPADSANQAPFVPPALEHQPSEPLTSAQKIDPLHQEDDSTHEVFSDLAAVAHGAADQPARPIASAKPKYKKLKLVLVLCWLVSLAFMLWAIHYTYQRMHGAAPGSDTSTAIPATLPASTMPSTTAMSPAKS